MFPVTGGVGTSDPGRITYHGVWLPSLIADAFGVRPDQINGPAWMKTERYDIAAVIPKGATKDQFKLMLGNLLRDRFHLRFHMDSKILPVYVLRAAKDGPKFRETVVNAPPADDGTPRPRVTGARDAQGFPVLPPDYQGSLALPVEGAIFVVAQGDPLSSLISWIGPKVGRPVIDETALAGRYDYRIHMEWMRRPPVAADVPSGVPTVFTALEEQLGLKLESASRPITQLIIDSIDREPTEN